MTVLEELLIKIGVKVEEEKLTKLAISLETVAKKLSAVNKAAILAASGFVYYANKIGGAEAEMLRFAKANGIAFESVQELAYAARQEGASTEEMLSTLSGLTEKIGEAARNGDEAFRRLGVSIQKPNGEFKDSISLLAEISDKVQGMSITRQREILGKVGITGNMVNLITQGAKAMQSYREQSRKAGITTAEQAEKMIKMQQATERAKQAFNNATQPLREMIYLAGTRLVEALSGVIEKFKGVSQSTITAWFYGLIGTIGVLSTALTVFSVAKFITQMSAAIKIIRGLTLSMAALDAVKKFGIAGLIGVGVIGGGILAYKGVQKYREMQGMTTPEAKAYTATTPSTASAPTNNMYGGNRQTVNQTIKIDVSGAGNPDDVGRAVLNEFKRQAKTGIPQFRTAVI